MRLVVLFALALAAVALGGWSWHYEQEAVALEDLSAAEVSQLTTVERRGREDRIEIAHSLGGKLAWEATVAGGLAILLGVWWLISQLVGWGERIALVVAILVGAAVPVALVYLGPLHL